MDLLINAFIMQFKDNRASIWQSKSFHWSAEAIMIQLTFNASTPSCGKLNKNVGQ